MSPWITSEIIKLKSSRRRLERTYISSHSFLDFKILRTATNRYHKAISAAKKTYFSSRILSSLSNLRTLWKNISHVLHRNSNRTLSTSSPLSSLPQFFATYFSDKITKLHFNLQWNPSATPIHLSLPSPLLSFPLSPLPHYWKLPTLIIQFILWSRSHPYNGSQVHIRCNISNHSIHCKPLPSHWHLSSSSKIITRQSTS